MRKTAIFFFTGFSLLWYSSGLKAQPRIIVAIDTAYAHTGKIEFPLSGFGDEITDFYGIFPDTGNVNTVTICGKVGTANANVKKIGLVQLKPNGTFNPSFGNAGKTILNWGGSDYPNSMFVTSDSNSFIFLAGASGQSGGDMIPAIFKFRKKGIPDSGFGGDGHVALRYDSGSGGEFTMVTSVSTKFLAAGRAVANSPKSHDGFCAMRFLPDGRLDSSYGIEGKAIIPDTNFFLKLHSVFSFLTTNASLTFIGVLSDNIDSSHSTIVLGRINPKGFPDSSFGKNGLLTTGNTFSSLSGISIVAGIQPDYKIVAALPPAGIAGLMPVRLVRFTSEGIIDSTYGTNGFTNVTFTNGESKARGINIAKNAKTVVAGSAVGALEQCATSRNNLDGTPDRTLNQIGTAVIDVDSGAYSNYLIRFVGIGNKRYIGVGASIHNGLSQFLVAHFKDDTLSKGGVAKSYESTDLLQIYPNPATSFFMIVAGQQITGDIKIIDALGREVALIATRQYSSDTKTYSFDVSQLRNGIYDCIAQYGEEKIVRKFLVSH
ncbi:MAG: T9SS type A sorting domain-containing protein [Candidatus Kapaibacterium sp.]